MIRILLPHWPWLALSTLTTKSQIFSYSNETGWENNVTFRSGGREEMLSFFSGLPFAVVVRVLDHWRFLQQIGHGESNAMGPKGTTAIDVTCHFTT